MTPVIKIVQYMWGESNKSYILNREINEIYCNRHGYKYIARTNKPRDDRHCVWEKVVSLREELCDCDYLLFLDADAFFYGQEFKVENELLPRMDDKLIMMANDIGSESCRWNPGMPNNGVIIVKNDPRSFEILKKWDESVENPEHAIWCWTLAYEQSACWNTIWIEYREDFMLLEDYYLMNGYHGMFIRHLMLMPDAAKAEIMSLFIQKIQNQ